MCGKPKGTPDPDANSGNDEMKHLSLRAILKAGPEAFNAEIQEVKRLEALKEVKGVFGVVLNTETPVVVVDCITFLRAQGMYTEGLFRIPGQQDVVDALKFRYVQEKNEDVLNKIPCEVNDVATLLKSYFRWLPEPIVPRESYDDVLDTCRVSHPTKAALEDAVFESVKRLQSPNRECFCLLIQFLREVAQFEQYNKMSPANLATCFAPSLLRAPEEVSPEQALMDMSPAIGVLCVLIRGDKSLFVPSKDQVKLVVKHKPKSVLPPPGMGVGGDKADKKRASRKKSFFNRRGSKDKDKRKSTDAHLQAPPGLGSGRAPPPPIPSRKDAKKQENVAPPKPAKELRKKSKMPASFDIDETI